MKKVQQLMIVTIVGTVWTLASMALVAAEQPAPLGQTKSMDDMMKECRTHCQTTTASIDQLTTKMEAAKQSNDPAQMRAALDEAQKPLTEMKEHMTGCMGMMSMMEKMHGGMGGMMKEGSGGHMGGMMQEKEPQSGAESR